MARFLPFTGATPTLQLNDGEKHEICLFGNGFIAVPFSLSRVMEPNPIYHQWKILPEKFNFIGKLRDYQVEIVKEAEENLQKFSVVTLECPPASGKTILGIFLSSTRKGKVLVLVEREFAESQWRNSFGMFSDASVLSFNHLRPPSSFSEYQVIICMIERVKYLPAEVKENIGTLIIDESHRFITLHRAKILLQILPNFLIFLSATPDNNPDPLLFEQFAGTNRVIRENFKPFTVFRVMTGIMIPMKKKDAFDWHAYNRILIDSAERMEILRKLVHHNLSRKILIFNSYIEYSTKIVEMLEGDGLKVAKLYGKEKVGSEANIIVATVQKAGASFDERTFYETFSGVAVDMVILLNTQSSNDLVKMMIGRVFRAEEPIVVQLIDHHYLAYNHWNENLKYYRKAICTIRDNAGKVLEGEERELKFRKKRG